MPPALPGPPSPGAAAGPASRAAGDDDAQHDRQHPAVPVPMHGDGRDHAGGREQRHAVLLGHRADEVGPRRRRSGRARGGRPSAAPRPPPPTPAPARGAPRRRSLRRHRRIVSASRSGRSLKISPAGSPCPTRPPPSRRADCRAAGAESPPPPGAAAPCRPRDLATAASRYSNCRRSPRMPRWRRKCCSATPPAAPATPPAPPPTSRSASSIAGGLRVQRTEARSAGREGSCQ